MSIKRIVEKFKYVLSEEDLLSVQEAIKKTISEEVKIRVEAEVDRMSIIAEEYCQKKIKARTKKLAEAMMIEKKKDLNKLEERVIDKLDRFLDLEISSKLNEDLLKNIAVNETLEPLVNGIRSLFENKFVALDSEGKGLIKKAESKAAELEEKVATLIKDKIELSETAEQAAIRLIIAEKTQNLTEKERKKVKHLCENKCFDDLYKKIDSYVEMVMEETKVKITKPTAKVVDHSESDCLTEQVVDLRKKDSDGSENLWKIVSNLI